jgi:hypothetical protein
VGGLAQGLKNRRTEKNRRGPNPPVFRKTGKNRQKPEETERIQNRARGAQEPPVFSGFSPCKGKKIILTEKIAKKKS